MHPKISVKRYLALFLESCGRHIDPTVLIIASEFLAFQRRCSTIERKPITSSACWIWFFSASFAVNEFLLCFFLTGVAIFLLIVVEASSLPTLVKSNICDGACEACVRRYGCMTPQWGQCCTQFYQYNGKRSRHSITDSEFMRHIEINNIRTRKKMSKISDNLPKKWPLQLNCYLQLTRNGAERDIVALLKNIVH